MKRLDIPGWGRLEWENLVLDFNGTIAQGGVLSPGVAQGLAELERQGIKSYVITADTNGTAAAQCAGLPLELVVCQGGDVASAKRQLVERLGAEHTLCIGNGRNDLGMFESSRLALCILGEEGCFVPAALAADILCPSIADALRLLIEDNRLKATLRG